MMWLWILAAVILLIALLCRTRVGVWAAFGGEELRLAVKFGLLRFSVLPAGPKKSKPRPEKPPRKKKKSRKKKEEQSEDKPKERSFTLEDGKDALRTLLPPLKRALSRTRRGIRVKPLRLSLILGGEEDPAAAARLYGEVQAAVWTGMPLAEKLLDIRDVRIHTDIDFTAPSTAVEGEAGVTLRIGTLLAVGFGMAFPALGWLFRWRRNSRRRKKAAGGPASPGPVEEPAGAEEE